MNIHSIDTDEKPGDSNEVICAKTVIRIYCEHDGISNEMTYAQIDFVNRLESAKQSAIEVLKDRELLCES